ncbi:hypothetical protein [Nocardia sp. alder85J]|uniref:hypothetical protein n=1 Tax=Nocardia sp. alder85J TaxID=2862949 RepID=UPI001CD2D890|nr:hypothetical protein [Nocardia sp. alder85J]MCX4090756.1 hypothetical protein [Nocardia sp. alder85J]
MNPVLPLTVNLLRRALAGAVVLALLVAVALTVGYYASGGWATPQHDIVHTLQRWQHTISHLVPFPWQ